ncbi:hypothetical protein PPACK8108_LOCUS13183 [Phakopsora pachyrhizi]|uniref:Uncharacterized protein n=1 Tax=Phakopsora pachyrhizi TaxID=170000 RepID=A0AAV0B383_PHAPC|nr:hypothetical protein PPACK8108_LOCUS13183 [Phakopsora pachyrhizi]
MQEPRGSKKTRKIFEESIPSLMRIGSGSASSLVKIRNRAPSSSTHFLFQQANRPLPTLSNNLTIKKDQGSKGGVYGLPMIEHGDQNCIGGGTSNTMFKNMLSLATQQELAQSQSSFSRPNEDKAMRTVKRRALDIQPQSSGGKRPLSYYDPESTPGHFIGAGAYIDAGSCYKSDRLREHQNFGLRFNPLEYIFRPTQLEATSGLNGEVKSLNELHEAVSLYDLVRTDSSDKQQSLLKPDILCGIYYHFFDAELFANSVLNNEPYHSISGSATQNLSAGDVGLVLSKLNIGIEDITKRLRSELLSKASSIASLHDSLQSTKIGLKQIKTNVERLYV